MANNKDKSAADAPPVDTTEQQADDTTAAAQGNEQLSDAPPAAPAKAADKNKSGPAAKTKVWQVTAGHELYTGAKPLGAGDEVDLPAAEIKRLLKIGIIEVRK